METVKKAVEAVYNKHLTNDAFEIARRSKIIVIEENLGNLNGYYHSIDGVEFIHINSKLFEIEKLVVCSHCLGHSILHKEEKSFFIERFRLENASSLDLEAYYFASCLLQHNLTCSEIERIKKTYKDIKDSMRFIELKERGLLLNECGNICPL